MSTCALCDQPLAIPGAHVYGPPDVDGLTRHWDVCVACFSGMHHRFAEAEAARRRHRFWWTSDMLDTIVLRLRTNGPENPVDIAAWLTDHGYHVADVTLSGPAVELMRVERITITGRPFSGESVWTAR